MKISVKASKSAKRRKSINSSCQSRRKPIKASYTEEDVSVLMEELERIGRDMAYDITSDDTADVQCVSESEDAYGETILVFEVSIGDGGEVLGTIDVGLNEDEDIDIDEISAWFEDEVCSIYDDAGLSRM